MGGCERVPVHCSEKTPGKLERVGLVQYKRQSDDSDANSNDDERGSVDAGRAFVRFVLDNEPLLDAVLYDWFPNATPGELDNSLDLLRFWRMVEAKSAMAAEDERRRFMSGDSKPPKPDDGERFRQHQRNAATWARHDELLRQFGLMDED